MFWYWPNADKADKFSDFNAKVKLNVDLQTGAMSGSGYRSSEEEKHDNLEELACDE